MSDPRKTSRREFLRGRAAAHALADAAAVALPVADSAEAQAATAPAAVESARATYLIRVGRRAMACEFEVLLNAGQYADGTELAVAALDLVDQLEGQLTVYRDSSEVSRLNRTAFARDVEVEPRLFALLSQAAEIHRRTAGAYDITSGPLSKVWGFYRRSANVPGDVDLATALKSVGSQHLAFDQQRRTVRFLASGLEINLGSIGKGYALDRAAELLESRGVADFMLHGGLSSVLARGSHGAEAGAGWRVGLRHPLRPGGKLGEIRLANRALATSGTGMQFFYHEGRRYGHILDPRTGRPAEAILSSTVIAPTAAEADATSTAFFVMGVEPALEYCRRHGGLAAILVTAGPRVGAVEVHTAGLGEGDWQPE